ncbi:MAG: hypothetical protein ABFE13_24445 [Phycisphaerales bacterium]
MYLRHIQRKKNGKDHSYWSIVESRRLVAAAGMADLIIAAQHQIDGEALVLLPDEANRVGVRFGGVPESILASHELAAAQ